MSLNQQELRSDGWALLEHYQGQAPAALPSASWSRVGVGQSGEACGQSEVQSEIKVAVTFRVLAWDAHTVHALFPGPGIVLLNLSILDILGRAFIRGGGIIGSCVG